MSYRKRLQYWRGYATGWLQSRRHWLRPAYWRGYLAGWLERAEVCPQCEGEDKHCLYCAGAGSVPANSAAEWRRQNSEVE